MAEAFDPYHLWLGIPADEQPPHYYRLLGVPLFEPNTEVIALAAQRQMAHIKTLALGKHARLSQRILGELARAKVCLLSPQRRARYDAELRQQLTPTTGVATGPNDDSAPRIWTIGAAADCDVVVDRASVSAHHCRLTRTPGKLLLEDLGSTNGTQVNGQPIRQPTAVSPRDTIRLGQREPLRWPKDVLPTALRVIAIGAAADNDVVICQPMVSGHHAQILLLDGEAIIEDLGSTNGTAIGQAANRISRAPLPADATVYLGSWAVPAADLIALRS